MGCFNRGLHEDHNVVNLNAGHGAEGINIGETPTDLHTDSEVDLSLTEGLNADDVVPLLCANDRLHVEHLTGYAVHHHREEIGVAEVQSARHVDEHSAVVVIKMHSDRANAIILHPHRAREHEEGHQRGGQQAQHHRQHHIQLRSLWTKPLITVWNQCNQLIYLI